MSKRVPKPHIIFEGGNWKCRTERRRGTWHCVIGGSPTDALRYWLRRRSYVYRKKLAAERGIGVAP